MNVAFDQIIDMDGLMTEDDYKYEGKQHAQCLLNKTKIRAKIDGYVNITSDENGQERRRTSQHFTSSTCRFILEMAQWLANNAPISIGLNANMMQVSDHRSLFSFIDRYLTFFQVLLSWCCSSSSNSLQSTRTQSWCPSRRLRTRGET